MLHGCLGHIEGGKRGYYDHYGQVPRRPFLYTLILWTVYLAVLGSLGAVGLLMLWASA